MKNSECQFLIVGAGITGLTISLELLQQGAEDILIIEKEKSLGLHASGRNSGVLHSGVYYTPDSLKAKFCIDGNRLMKQFCKENGLTLLETGKVIVTQSETELERLYEIKRRADANKTSATLIDRQQLREIEPHATTYQKALFMPETAVIQPQQVLGSLEKKLIASRKVRISYETNCEGLHGSHTIRTSRGAFGFDRFINAAGAYADRIANYFGVGSGYKILPFKGTYKKIVKDRTHLVCGNIYPVPDLRNPFLGVHLTKNAEGDVYVGPTAIPAFGRENYNLFEGIGIDTPSIVYRDFLLFLVNPAFRAAALSEPKKYLKRFIYKEAKRLVPELNLRDIEESKKVGIRPQLVHWPSKQLVTDFLVLRDGQSIHILNAISPAFTSSMAFAKYVVSRMLENGGGFTRQVGKPVAL